MYSNRHKTFRHIGVAMDVINIMLAIAIIILGIVIIIDVNKYIILFPVLFTVSALMNIILAIKHYKMSEMSRALVLGIASIGLIVISIIGYITVL